MNFIEAVKAMKEGKTVEIKEDDARYRLVDNKIIYIPLSDNDFWTSDNTILFFVNKEFRIVEEKKTLSDKVHKGIAAYPNHYDGYNETDVKEALKEFIAALPNDGLTDAQFYLTKAKEIFGERLI